MSDRIFGSFLKQQHTEGRALADASDVLDLLCLTPQRFVATYHCKGLVRGPGGTIEEAGLFQVGIFLPADYLRRANPYEVLHWFGPPNVFHPNISDKAPFICVGRLVPGMPLVDLLHQVYEIITYQKVTPREDDALNTDACAWVRHHSDRIPTDRRPLRRRSLSLEVKR